jgi:hypothetical protein
MMQVYVLIQSEQLSGLDFIVGVFSTKNLAEARAAEIATTKDFQDGPQSIHVIYAADVDDETEPVEVRQIWYARWDDS